MTATAPAMTLQVRDRDKVMEPHRWPVNRRLTSGRSGGEGHAQVGEHGA